MATTLTKKMTVEEIRAYIRDNLQKAGKKPETIITGSEVLRGYVFEHSIISRVKKGIAEYPGRELVRLMVSDVHPVTKQTRVVMRSEDLASIKHIADA